MRRHLIGNLATAAFFAVLSLLFFTSFILFDDWPPMGRGTSVLFAILFAGLAYRVVWGMRYGE